MIFLESGTSFGKLDESKKAVDILEDTEVCNM
jgi:hypothetical protein